MARDAAGWLGGDALSLQHLSGASPNAHDRQRPSLLAAHHLQRCQRPNCQRATVAHGNEVDLDRRDGLIHQDGSHLLNESVDLRVAREVSDRTNRNRGSIALRFDVGHVRCIGQSGDSLRPTRQTDPLPISEPLLEHGEAMLGAPKSDPACSPAAALLFQTGHDTEGADMDGPSGRSMRSRRAVLGAAVGGAAAAAAHVLATSARAQAADGEALVLGEDNASSSETKLAANLSETSEAGLRVVVSGSGRAAVSGSSPALGLAGEGITGVVGSSNSANGSGVLGEDLTFSNVGRGVQGISHDGWGVFAVSDGQALRVDGRATFSRSGIVNISHPRKTATVNVPGDLSTSSNFPERPSLALAVVQNNLPGVYVRSAVLNPLIGSLTIYLNKAPGTVSNPKTAAVGWFLVN